MEKKSFKEKAVEWVKELIPYVVVIVSIVLIRTFIITPIAVHGTSMYPNLNNGQVLLLKKFDRSFDRFDIVVLKYGKDRLIKRVIGLPGEHIEYRNSKLYVNGVEVEESMITATTRDFKLEDIGYSVIPDGYYFVLGDNRPLSKDSRYIGLIKKSDMIGTVDFSLFPFNRFGFTK